MERNWRRSWKRLHWTSSAESADIVRAFCCSNCYHYLPRSYSI